MFSKNNKKSKIKFSFPLPLKRKESVHGDILIKGKLLVFIVCSIVSALINLIFISGLTKSPYTIGTLVSIPAAIFLGSLSIALDLSKALHVIQVNTLNELYRKLADKPWAKVIKSQARKWNSIYILYVILSIITSISLSTISIGEGISRNKSIINSINIDIEDLNNYKDASKTSDNIEFDSMIKSYNNSDSAISLAQQKFSEIEQEIKSYRAERSEFPASFDSVEEIDYNDQKIIPSEYWDKKNKDIQNKVNASGINLTLNQIRTMSYIDIQNMVKTAQEKFTSNKNTSSLTELAKKSNDKAYTKIKNLNGRYIYPDTWKDGVYIKGQDVVFAEEDISGAIDKLSNLKVKYENDNGDIGNSSKIFIQLGTAIDSIKSNNSNKDLSSIGNTKVSSFGTTELLMMGMLLFLSLLCELAINQFSPKASITRKMLSQFSQYFPKDFNVNEFMMQVAYDARDYDEISDKELESQIKYCQSRIDIKNKVSAKPEKVHVEKDIDNKKIEQLISDIGGELND